MKLFSAQYSKVSILDDQVFLIKEFKTIYNRDLSKNKEQALLEFAYVYHIADFHSYPNQNGLDDEDAHNFAIDACGFPPTWKPDDELNKLIIRYKQLTLTPIKRLHKELLTGLENTNKIVNNKVLKLVNKEEVSNDEIEVALGMQRKILDLAGEVPDRMKELRTSIKLVEAEEGEKKKKIRGGEDIEESMNPDNEIDSIK